MGHTITTDLAGGETANLVLVSPLIDFNSGEIITEVVVGVTPFTEEVDIVVSD